MHWGEAQSARGRSLRGLYQACRAQNRELPASLRELGEHAETSALAKSRRRADAPWRLRWAFALADGLESSRLRTWRAQASPTQRARQAVLGNGRWALQEPSSSTRYSRTEWLVAARLWFGLDVTAAMPDAADCAKCCQNRYVVANPDGTRRLGGTCRSKPGGRRRGNQAGFEPTPLDAKGLHALVCKVGSAAVLRHSYIRDVLRGALRPLVSGVWWERYLPDIVRAAGADKSRLDLVVRDPVHAGMLDVVVVFPLQPCGTRVYRHVDHEHTKFLRYQLRRDGRRQHALPLIPVVVSTFGVLNKGVLNELSSTYLADIEKILKHRRS